MKELIVNEVIVVGRVRQGQENAVLPKGPNGENLPADSEELKKAVRDKFTFLKDTVPDAAAKAAGFLSGKYIQCRLADPGGETLTLPDGRVLQRSRKTNSYGWKNIFKSQNGITYDEIADHIIAGNFVIVGTGNEGQIRLTKYGLMGLWDEFNVGFLYTIMTRDASGKMVPMISHRRDRKTGKFVDTEATSFTGRHFILESEYDNIEGLRQAFIKSVEPYKVVSTATEPGAPDGSGAEPQNGKPPVNTTSARDDI